MCVYSPSQQWTGCLKCCRGHSCLWKWRYPPEDPGNGPPKTVLIYRPPNNQDPARDPGTKPHPSFNQPLPWDQHHIPVCFLRAQFYPLAGRNQLSENLIPKYAYLATQQQSMPCPGTIWALTLLTIRPKKTKIPWAPYPTVSITDPNH